MSPVGPVAWVSFLRQRAKWDQRRQFAAWFYTATALINVVSIVIVAYFGFLQPSWLTFTNLPLPVAHDVIPGGPIVVTASRCNTSGAGRVYLASRRMVRVDQAQPDITLGAAAVPVQAGCTTITSDRLIAPTFTPLGVYELHGDDEVSGTWRTTHVDWQSQRFNVVPAASSPR